MTSSLQQRRGLPHGYILGIPETAAFQVIESAIIFNGRLSLSDWESLGKRLLALTESVTWWTADWLVYGENTYKDRYQEAIKRTSLSYQTLRNYAWVAKRFNIDRRRANLSFGHHAEVASLEQAESDFWLRKAEEFDWSRNRLRQEVRASLRERNEVEPTSDDPDGDGEPLPPNQDSTESSTENGEALRIRLTSGQLEQCETAARKSGMDLTNWAARVLLAAACQSTWLSSELGRVGT
jgi:hypothetical protein